MLSEHWRTFLELLMTSCGPIEEPEAFEELNDFSGHWGIFANLTTYWGIEDVDKFLRTLWTIWVSFEDLRPEDVGELFVHFPDLLRTLWTFLRTFWRPEDLSISKRWRNFQDLLLTSCALVQELLRTLWGPFNEHLRNFCRPQDFEDADNFLGTLMSPWIPFVDLWGPRGLWWPFKEFEDILRIIWEPETWGPWVPFVHFLDFLRTLWTFWGLFEDLWTWGSQNIEEPFRNFWWLLVEHLRTVVRNIWVTLWGPFDDHLRNFWRPQWILRTLITFWGIEVDLEYLLWTSEDFEGFDDAFEEFEDILRISWEPATWGPWVPFVHFLDFLRTLWTFWGLFKDLWTWGSQNIEEPFWNFLMTSCGPFEDCF